jgi:hypothetical protein
MDRFSILLKKSAPKPPIMVDMTGSVTSPLPTIIPTITASFINPDVNNIETAWTSSSESFSVIPQRPSFDIQQIHPNNGDILFISVPFSYSDSDISSLCDMLNDHFHELNIICKAILYRV